MNIFHYLNHLYLYWHFLRYYLISILLIGLSASISLSTAFGTSRDCDDFGATCIWFAKKNDGLQYNNEEMTTLPEWSMI